MWSGILMGLFLDSPDLGMTYDDYYRGEYADWIVGLRFQNVEVPQGAEIDKACLEFTADETSAQETSLTFHCQASNDAWVFTEVDHDMSERPLTSSSVSWNNVPPWTVLGRRYQSPNLAEIVKEVTDRPGWSSGNAIVFVISGNGRRHAESYEADPKKSATLRIEYSLGSHRESPPSGPPPAIPGPPAVSSPPTSPKESLKVHTRVSNGKDDVEERNSDGFIYVQSKELDIVFDSNKNGYQGNGIQLVGLRFQRLLVPHGAHITAASMLDGMVWEHNLFGKTPHGWSALC